MYLAPTILAI
jgi:hypothetical protein